MPPPELFVFFGLIASGKSTVAQAWARQRGLAYYNSDLLRKELAGSAAGQGRQTAHRQGIYSEDFSEKTYRALLTRAEEELRQGRGVALDASYQRRSDRDRLRLLADQLSVRPCFILCVCPEEEMKRRMALRALDPNAVSDGRWEIYLKQKEVFEAPTATEPGRFVTLATDLPVQAILQQLSTLLETKA